MRFRGFEFEDQPWLPGIIRDSMTDYLRFLFRTFSLYKPVLPILKDALVQTHSDQVLDLCSGSGGAIEEIYENLKCTYSADIKVILSDLYPSMLKFKYFNAFSPEDLSYLSFPVDAFKVPPGIKGFRTIFSGFHHFEREKAKDVLRNAVENGEGIGIFDGGDRNLWMVLLIIVFHPFMILLCTPFFRPFRISRLFFTYLVPIIPFCTVWDGVFSIIRLYRPDELLRIAREIEPGKYSWNSGKVKNQYGMNIAYLVGYPDIEKK